MRKTSSFGFLSRRRFVAGSLAVSVGAAGCAGAQTMPASLDTRLRPRGSGGAEKFPEREAPDRTDFLVGTEAEFDEAQRRVRPGQVIRLKDGDYEGFKIGIWEPDGTEDQPIWITAETPGGVSLHGDCHVSVWSPHVVVRDLRFEDAGSVEPPDQVYVNDGRRKAEKYGDSIHLGGEYSRAERCRFQTCGPIVPWGRVVALAAPHSLVNFCDFVDGDGTQVGNPPGHFVPHCRLANSFFLRCRGGSGNYGPVWSYGLYGKGDSLWLCGDDPVLQPSDFLASRIMMIDCTGKYAWEFKGSDCRIEDYVFWRSSDLMDDGAVWQTLRMGQDNAMERCYIANIGRSVAVSGLNTRLADSILVDSAREYLVKLYGGRSSYTTREENRERKGNSHQPTLGFVCERNTMIQTGNGSSVGVIGRGNNYEQRPEDIGPDDCAYPFTRDFEPSGGRFSRNVILNLGRGRAYAGGDHFERSSTFSGDAWWPNAPRGAEEDEPQIAWAAALVRPPTNYGDMSFELPVPLVATPGQGADPYRTLGAWL